MLRRSLHLVGDQPFEYGNIAVDSACGLCRAHVVSLFQEVLLSGLRRPRSAAGSTRSICCLSARTCRACGPLWQLPSSGTTSSGLVNVNVNVNNCAGSAAGEAAVLMSRSWLPRPASTHSSLTQLLPLAGIPLVT